MIEEDAISGADVEDPFGVDGLEHAVRGGEDSVVIRPSGIADVGWGSLVEVGAYILLSHRALWVVARCVRRVRKFDPLSKPAWSLWCSWVRFSASLPGWR